MVKFVDRKQSNVGRKYQKQKQIFSLYIVAPAKKMGH